MTDTQNSDQAETIERERPGVWQIDIIDPDGKTMQLKVDEQAANQFELGPVRYVSDTVASMIETLHAA